MSHNESAMYHSNGYNSQATCEHCEGIIRQTVCGDLSNTTQLCPFLVSSRTILAPIRPSPIIPSCIKTPFLKIAVSFRTIRVSQPDCGRI